MSERSAFAVYVKTNKNIGDDASTPLHYFPGLSSAFRFKTLVVGSALDGLDIAPGTPVIVGGGGLLASKEGWDRMFFGLLERGCRVVGWGIGLNRSRARAAADPGKLPEFASRFELLGLRDWKQSPRWVPCASAMSPLFDETHQPQRKLGFFLHLDRTDRMPEEIAALASETNTMTNQGSFADLEKVVRFIGESEVVITNSYHGAYWSILARRPVIVFDAFSEKFDMMRWPPVHLEGTKSLDAALATAEVFPSALEEARAANRAFYDEFVGRFMLR